MKTNKIIQEAVLAFIEKNNLTQATVAKRVNVSKTTLSMYLQGSYAGDVLLLETKLKQFLEREKNRKQSNDFVFVETSLSQKIQQSCSFAFDTQDIVLIIGASGVGKTAALKKFKEKTKSVIYIECDLSFTPKNILLEIAQQLKLDLEKTGKNLFALNDAILKDLKDRDVLLIFDEAELLSYKSLETIRRIHDKSETAIVLAGMPKLRANLRGKKGDFFYFFSRIGIAVDVGSEVSEADLGKVIAEQGEFSNFAEDLKKLAKGNLRRLTKILKGSRQLLKKGEKLDSDTLKTYASFLIS